MDMSDHLFFTSLQKAYRSVMRIDGQPGWKDAVIPASGGAPLSWAVTLENRI